MGLFCKKMLVFCAFVSSQSFAYAKSFLSEDESTYVRSHVTTSGVVAIHKDDYDNYLSEDSHVIKELSLYNETLLVIERDHKSVVVVSDKVFSSLTTSSYKLGKSKINFSSAVILPQARGLGAEAVEMGGFCGSSCWDDAVGGALKGGLEGAAWGVGVGVAVGQPVAGAAIGGVAGATAGAIDKKNQCEKDKAEVCKD